MSRGWDLTRRIERINGVTARPDFTGFMENRFEDTLAGNVFDQNLMLRVMRRMHPLVRITLVAKESAEHWRVIGVFVSDDHPTYAVFIDCNQAIHRPRICFELISSAEAMGFVSVDSEYQHHLFSEIMFRIGCCILGHTPLDDFEAFGVTTTPESQGVGGWRGVWETYNDEDTGEPQAGERYWRGEIYGPTRIGEVYERNENERGWLLDSHAYGAFEPEPESIIDDTHMHPEIPLLGEELLPEIKPMWREDRPIIYFKKTRVKHPYWIEETRCSACGQRIIISLAEAQCPTGIPATLVKCGSCKREFQFH